MAEKATVLENIEDLKNKITNFIFHPAKAFIESCLKANTESTHAESETGEFSSIFFDPKLSKFHDLKFKYTFSHNIFSKSIDCIFKLTVEQNEIIHQQTSLSILMLEASLQKEEIYNNMVSSTVNSIEKIILEKINPEVLDNSETASDSEPLLTQEDLQLLKELEIPVNNENLNIQEKIKGESLKMNVNSITQPETSAKIPILLFSDNFKHYEDSILDKITNSSPQEEFLFKNPFDQAFAYRIKTNPEVKSLEIKEFDNPIIICGECFSVVEEDHIRCKKCYHSRDFKHNFMIASPKLKDDIYLLYDKIIELRIKRMQNIYENINTGIIPSIFVNLINYIYKDNFPTISSVSLLNDDGTAEFEIEFKEAGLCNFRIVWE